MPRESPIILVVTLHELNYLIDNCKFDLKILIESGAYLEAADQLHLAVNLLSYLHDKQKGYENEN